MPVLVAIYPIAIVLIFLTFAEPLFKGRDGVYRWSLLLTGLVSIVDGIKAAGISIDGLYQFLGKYLPLFEAGMGWLLPALIGALIGYALSFTRTPESASLKKAN